MVKRPCWPSDGEGSIYRWVFLFCFVLLSCSDPSTVRIRGSFENMRQADLYIYSPDGGMSRVDTIQVLDGQFQWQTALDDEATFCLVFPNMSEQTILARPGDRLRVKGDGGQLRALTIKGSRENEELTRFRLAHLTDAPDSLQRAMRAFITAHPESRVSTVLQRQLTRQQGHSSRLRVGQTLPAIVLPPDSVETDAFTELSIDLKTGRKVRGKTTDRNTADTLFVRPKQKDARPVLLIFWASWKRSTMDDFPDIRKALRQHADLQPISISLDYQRSSYLYSVKADSISFDRRCYFRLWDTPVVAQLAIGELPYYVLADSTRQIQAIGTDWKRDIAPAVKSYNREIVFSHE